MTEFVWIPKSVILEVHTILVNKYGGLQGIRNESTLESTLQRPQNLHFYQPGSTLYDLAACYGYGLIKNHCFVDGNKRTAFAAINLFLNYNGYKLVLSRVAAVALMEEVAETNVKDVDLVQLFLASEIQQGSTQLKSL